ncbi:MAG: alpha-amylase family protein [Fulvivirga sp.]
MKYWFKNTTIYCLEVDAFQDGNGDGCGDFKGLVDRMEYLSTIGVETLWILPIFKTPNKDNGYDVSDYFVINENLGNLGEFTEVLARAEEFSIRIILDLPLNHTSDQHPWFQASREDINSKYRNYYIWTKEKPQEPEEKLIFGDQQGGNWKYDEVAEAYFYHTFYDFQPDLNYDNLEVRKEVRRVMHFWLRVGISGFRIDALPHIIRSKGSNIIRNQKKIIREFRQFMEEISCEAVLIGETDVEPEKYKDFFGRDNKFQMLLNFYLSSYIFSALAKKKKSPIEYALDMLPRANSFQQYVNFLRNHDELDLERLNESERKEVFDAFGPKDNMQIFGRGIRRRLAPMLNNDRRLLELGYSILFSMPGSPVIRYGDELGMGDDLSQEGRNSVRTVMQWSNEDNAGFSSAPEKKLVKPVIKDKVYGKDNLNVELQFKEEGSLLNWIIKLIRMRRKCLEFGRGKYHIIDSGHEAVLAHYSKLENEIALAVHNLSEEEVTVEINLGDDNVKRLVHCFGDKVYDLLEDQQEKWKIMLSPFGYRWFQGRVEKRKKE